MTEKNRYSFQRILYIDGTHISIVAPTENKADYVHRNKYHSIVMQAVVDSGYLFRDFVVSWSGSVHDARVLSTPSCISTKLVLCSCMFIKFPEFCYNSMHGWSARWIDMKTPIC